MRKLEIMGVGRPVVGIVIPAGFSFNLDGSAVYLTMATLFLAQAVGMDLCWQQQLVMVGVMMLTSKGTAGIAGGAFIVLASTLTAVGGIPLATLALIVGHRPDPQRGPRVHQRPGQRRRDHRHRQVGGRLRPRTSPQVLSARHEEFDDVELDDVPPHHHHDAPAVTTGAATNPPVSGRADAGPATHTTDATTQQRVGAQRGGADEG